MLNTPWTRDEHKEVRAAIKSLIQEGSIRKFGKPEKSDVLDSHDLIVDFLVKALQHVEKELIRLHGFSRHCPVEFASTKIPCVKLCCFRTFLTLDSHGSSHVVS